MRRLLALVTAAAFFISGCATAGAPRVTAAPATRSASNLALLASYVKQLPVGSRVRVELVTGGRLTGTLMKATDDTLFIQRRTRLPEPPSEVRLDTVLTVELDNGSSSGRTIWAAAAAGAGGALAVFLVLAAIFAGD